MSSENKDIDINLATDKKLDTLLKKVVKEINVYAMDQIKHIRRFSEIGIALSIEKNITALFDMILDEARQFCHAEAGTLYIVDSNNHALSFAVLQNAAMDFRIDKNNAESGNLPDVPLFIDHKPNYSNVSSYVALTGKTVNIPDIYHINDKDAVSRTLDFSGTKKYDRKTGYQTKSMLVIPMQNHEDEIIGVLQLINAKDDNARIVPFSSGDVDIISSLTSQAAIALTNAQLVQELKTLFYSFIRSIAAAIDEKSAYTGGHIRRVVDLTMMIAAAVNDSTTPHFAGIHLDDDQMEELRIAAWLHDVGKITTPEYVVNKSAKLETIFDRIELVETRFALIAKSIEYAYLDKKCKKVAEGCKYQGELAALDQYCADEIAGLQDDLAFIRICNAGSEFMDSQKISRIREIGSRRFLFNGKPAPYLTDNEMYNLCIQKGTLTDKERKIIENHAKMTFKITSSLPFPKKMENVPEYAASHHEKLNNSGYPNGYGEDRLPLQSRILAIADIFEALTAKDRPYKETMRLSRALKILETMKADNHIDPDICDLFVESRLYLQYAKKEMNPEQIDL